MKTLKQAMLILWFDGSDPVNDPPDEIAGVMQDSLDRTVTFAGKVLQAHYAGKCACQLEEGERRDA